MLGGRSAVLPQRGAMQAAALRSSRTLPAALTAQPLRRNAAGLRSADFTIQVTPHTVTSSCLPPMLGELKATSAAYYVAAQSTSHPSVHFTMPRG